MYRYFEKNIRFGTFEIKGQSAHHIKNVVRLKSGSKIILCDGEKNDYECVITGIFADSIEVNIQTTYENKNETDYKISLYQSVPKQDKLEHIIQKAVELGVSEIYPVLTERSEPTFKGVNNKIERYNQIAEAAARQSGRGIIPIVHPLVKMLDVDVDESHLIAYECGGVSIRGVDKMREVSLWIGPEGGFSLHEIEWFSEFSGKIVSLGKRVLRTETAAVVALAQMSVLWDGD